MGKGVMRQSNLQLLLLLSMKSVSTHASSVREDCSMYTEIAGHSLIGNRWLWSLLTTGKSMMLQRHAWKKLQALIWLQKELSNLYQSRGRLLLQGRESSNHYNFPFSFRRRRIKIEESVFGVCYAIIAGEFRLFWYISIYLLLIVVLWKIGTKTCNTVTVFSLPNQSIEIFHYCFALLSSMAAKRCYVDNNVIISPRNSRILNVKQRSILRIGWGGWHLAIRTNALPADEVTSLTWTLNIWTEASQPPKAYQILVFPHFIYLSDPKVAINHVS